MNDTINTAQQVAVAWEWWLPVGVFLVLTMIVWLIIRRRKSERYQLKKKLKGESVNFDNVIHNAFYSSELYDSLKKVCHPDRFIGDDQLVERATEIFALVAANRYNSRELLKLKERAEKELNISINVANE